ncbi:MAG: DUF1592 domain-containing protein [Archangiaceae bacterium]|nr:DUF1592 domain-containing protein [Archangiaceae bacterium]
MRSLGLSFLILAAGCVGDIDLPGRSGSVSPFDPTHETDPNNPTDPTDPTHPTDPTNPTPPPPPDKCAGIAVAAAPTALRRLSVEQQRNAYRDVLNDQTANPDLAPIAGPVITEGEVEKLNLAAHALVARKGHQSYLKCSITGALNSTCAEQFIADFGRAVFRRALTTAEVQQIKAESYDAVRTNAKITPSATFQECIDATAEIILQSPDFLYLYEQGVSDSSLPVGVRRLTGSERAARLSFLLWNSTPDTTLLTAAEAGQLDTADGVKAQATRLLMDGRARKAVRSVINGWLELDGNSHQASLEAAPKDKTRFPFDTPALRAAMREELLSLYERAFFDLNGSFKALMTTNKAYVNKSLGSLYGVTAGLPASDSTSAWVDLDVSQRAGLFTRAGFLALYAPQTMQSPIRRGVFLYRNALGLQLAPPPPDVDNTPLKPAANALSVRQQVEARTAPISCQGCHARINALGFTLENYDAMGRYQTEEKGTLDGVAYTAPVNSTATLVATDINGETHGAVELSTKLSNSGQAHDAMVKVWFARANDRATVANDACNLQRLSQRFRQTDDMRDLLVSLVSSDSSSSSRSRHEQPPLSPPLPARLRRHRHRAARSRVHAEQGLRPGRAEQALSGVLRARRHAHQPHRQRLRLRRLHQRQQ